MAEKRWAAYGRPENGVAALLGVVEAEAEKPAIKAAMSTFGVSWRGVYSVRVLGSEEPAAFVDARKPGESRPWDGSDLEPHALSLRYPGMGDAAYKDLLESVQSVGAKEDIVLFEGKILDGRHRYKAYREVGVPFNVREWTPEEWGDPLKFVKAKNQARRDLTVGQRAALAVEDRDKDAGKGRETRQSNLKTGVESPDPRRFKNESSGGRATENVAKAHGVSVGYVHEVGKIREASPETFEQLKRGEVSIPEAREKLGLAKPKKPKPEPDPVPSDSGLVTVNGERKYDEGVERARAAGVIPAGVAVTVEDPGDEAGDVIQAVREEQAEEAAKVDDLTDDEWIARLPLASVLTGVSLTRFRMDALFFRAFEQKMRGSLKAFYGKAAKAYYKGSFRGVVGYGIERLLRVEPPDRWRKCPPTDKGGCDGKGTVPIVGECGLCHGRGYLSK
ncbi:ParB N-terminal domain-containing protein [Paludisphaera rhizosphaerae]|uniref:hypothetical protein n=1 Tax=Paludisphaera rhizosphaerae TaxID=2711216 RepID=UPI0013EC2520|nr:hypothetical protein [Paludisphaera rhizosphaerae]